MVLSAGSVSSRPRFLNGGITANNRYTSIDMMRILPGNNGSNPPMSFMSQKNCSCCCYCGAANQQQINNFVSRHGSGASFEDQDGPEGLSWRRLHMCRAKLKATATTSELLSGFAMV